jgi:hypothetical protein
MAPAYGTALQAFVRFGTHERLGGGRVTAAGVRETSAARCKADYSIRIEASLRSALDAAFRRPALGQDSGFRRAAEVLR